MIFVPLSKMNFLNYLNKYILLEKKIEINYQSKVFVNRRNFRFNPIFKANDTIPIINELKAAKILSKSGFLNKECSNIEVK